MRSRISVRFSPVAVMPWLRRPITAWAGSGSRSISSATDSASSCVPHGCSRRSQECPPSRRARGGSRRRRGDAVDHPVLDRVHRHAAWLDAGRHAEDDASIRLVVPDDKQVVAPDGLELGLVHATRTHPESASRPSGGEVAVGEAAHLVEPHHAPQVALRQAPRTGNGAGTGQAGRGACPPHRLRRAISSPSQSSGSRSGRNSLSITSFPTFASGASRA